MEAEDIKFLTRNNVGRNLDISDQHITEYSYVNIKIFKQCLLLD